MKQDEIIKTITENIQKNFDINLIYDIKKDGSIIFKAFDICNHIDYAIVNLNICCFKNGDIDFRFIFNEIENSVFRKENDFQYLDLLKYINNFNEISLGKAYLDELNRFIIVLKNNNVDSKETLLNAISIAMDQIYSQSNVNIINKIAIYFDN